MGRRNRSLPRGCAQPEHETHHAPADGGGGVPAPGPRRGRRGESGRAGRPTAAEAPMPARGGCTRSPWARWQIRAAGAGAWPRGPCLHPVRAPVHGGWSRQGRVQPRPRPPPCRGGGGVAEQHAHQVALGDRQRGALGGGGHRGAPRAEGGPAAARACDTGAPPTKARRECSTPPYGSWAKRAAKNSSGAPITHPARRTAWRSSSASRQPRTSTPPSTSATDPLSLEPVRLSVRSRGSPPGAGASARSRVAGSQPPRGGLRTSET